jgi:hypothetical protein
MPLQHTQQNMRIEAREVGHEELSSGRLNMTNFTTGHITASSDDPVISLANYEAETNHEAETANQGLHHAPINVAKAHQDDDANPSNENVDADQLRESSHGNNKAKITAPSAMPSTPDRQKAHAVVPRAPTSQYGSEAQAALFNTHAPPALALINNISVTQPPAWIARPFTAFEMDVKEHALPVLAANLGPMDIALVICDPSLVSAAAVIGEHQRLFNGSSISRVTTFPRPTLTYPTITEIQTHAPGSYSKIICLGLTDLATALNDSEKLPAYKSSLIKGGYVVLELQWTRGSNTWRDVAQRYRQAMYPCGFTLHAVNGCSLALESSEKVEKVEMRSKYINLAWRLRWAAQDVHKKLRYWLKEQGENAGRQGIKQDRGRLYGTFHQSRGYTQEGAF